MKQIYAFLLPLALSVATTHATLFTWTMGPTVIPDANPNGLATTVTVSGLADRITDVNVYVNVSGGFNGDLYGYLSFGEGTAILLNRVGKTSSDSFGYGDTGFVIKLDDQASQVTDIHLYQNVQNYSITGNALWRPDGRDVDPQQVLDTSSQTAFLSSFNNLDPNGTWTLFFADMASGEQATLISWALEIEAVPEPINQALAGFGVLAGAVVLWRRLRQKSSPEVTLIQDE